MEIKKCEVALMGFRIYGMSSCQYNLKVELRAVLKSVLFTRARDSAGKTIILLQFKC